MINIEYIDGIKITTGDLNGTFSKDELPLKFEIKKVISKEVVWTVDLESNMWAVFPENEINDVVIKDAKGNFVYQHYWDLMKHGTIFYKSLWFYCKNLINKGIRPVGLVIGTHDGEFGEWAPLVRNFMSDMLLVEGSQKQYEKLVQNYSGKEGITFLNELITTDGNNVQFFEGGKGYTNSVVERVIRGWEKEEIHSTVRTSISINDLIDSNFTVFGRKLDWLHLDVEGLDAKLLLTMRDDLLPNFIIFEDFNLIPEEKEKIFNFFKDKNYYLHSEAGICMVRKLN